MVRIIFVVALLMAKSLSSLVFSGQDKGPWPIVSSAGQPLGMVEGTPIEKGSCCYGMDILANGTPWAALDYFYLFTKDFKGISGGIVPVETMVGESARYLYKIRRGPSLGLKPPQIEYSVFLDEIDPNDWKTTRSWRMPGVYSAYGSGHLSVDDRTSVVFFATEKNPKTRELENFGTIHRYDLKNSLPLSDLVSRTVGSSGLLSLWDSTIVVGYRDKVQKYDLTGQLLLEFSEGVINVAQGLIARGVRNSIWVQGHSETTEYSTLFNFDTKTGNTLNQFDTPDDGTNWGAPFVDPPLTEPREKIIVTSGSQELRAYDSITGALLTTNTDGLNGNSTLRLTPDRAQLIATDTDNPLHVELSDSETLSFNGRSLISGGTVLSNRFAIDDDGYTYFQQNSGSDSIISQVDPTWTVVFQRTVGPNDVWIEVNPGGTILYLGGVTDNRIRRYDIVADAMLSDLATLAADERGRNIARDAAGNIFVLASGDGGGYSGARIYGFTPSGTQIFSTIIYPINGGAGTGEGIAVSPDGLRVWVRATTPFHAWLHAYSAIDGTFIRSIDGADTDLSSTQGIVVSCKEIPAGSLAFTWLDSSVAGAPVVIYLSPDDLSVVGSRASIPDDDGGGLGDSIDSGAFFTERAEIWSPCNVQLLATAVGGGSRQPRGNYIDRWYGPENVIVPVLARIGSTFPDGTTSTYSSFSILDSFGFTTGINEVAVGPANDIAYYKVLGSGHRKNVYRYDLVNDVDLGLWVSESTRELRVGQNLLVLRDGTVLVGWCGVSVTTSVVKRYATDGTLLQTYTFPTASNNDPMNLVSGRDDTTFWVAFYGGAEYSTLVEVLVSDGSFVNFHEITNAQKLAIDARFSGIDWQPDIAGFHVTRIQCGECGVTMACPDPCDKAGHGIPYFVLNAEQNTTLFLDRAMQLAQVPPLPASGDPCVISTPGACAVAPSSAGIWICMDDGATGGSLLIEVDPNTIDTGTGECKILREAIAVKDENGADLRICELGGRRSLWVLDECGILLTADRTLHQLIEICLPAEDDLTGSATVKKRYSLFVDKLDFWLIESGKAILYVDGPAVKVFTLKSDSITRTVVTCPGDVIMPTLLNDNTFLVWQGDFLNGQGNVLRYTRVGKLVKNFQITGFLTFSQGIWGLTGDLLTDACNCGSKKEGQIIIVGEDNPQALPISLLDGTVSPYIQLTDVVEGGINTAAAFMVIGNVPTGSGFNQQNATSSSRSHKRGKCATGSGSTTVSPNPGCYIRGRGWVPTYTGASGVIPDCDDPVGEEKIRGKRPLYMMVQVIHSLYPTGTEDLNYSTVTLDDTVQKEGLVRSIGSLRQAASDKQGNMKANQTDIYLMDHRGKLGEKITDPSKKYLTRDEINVRMISADGRRSGAIPRMLSRGMIYGESYGTPKELSVTAVSSIFIEGGAYSPDKKIPMWNYPLSYYTNAPKDLAQKSIPIYFGEVSDEGAKDETGALSEKGKCPLIYVGEDILGTGGGGQIWGRFNICLFPAYKVINLYGSDLGGMGLYGMGAVASVLSSFETDEEDQTTTGSEQTFVDLPGAVLTNVATDESALLVLWTKTGRVEMPIISVNGTSVGVNGSLDITAAQGVNWYICTTDYVPKRGKIDLATRNGVDVMIAGYAGFIRPTPYEDFTSVDGDYRVFDSWIQGPLLDAHLAGEVTLACNLIGIEDQGDGSGLPITEYFTAYAFAWDNLIHRQLQKPSAAGGLWPQAESDLPLWADGLSRTKRSSFAAAQALSVERVGGIGYEISAAFTEAISIRDFVQLFNDNVGCHTYEDDHGRVCVLLIDEFQSTSSFTRVDHDALIFGEVRRRRALDELVNHYKGGCDWDPEMGYFREDDMFASDAEAIKRNKGFRRFSKHIDGKLVAKKSQFQHTLNRRLFFDKDGPIYVQITDGHAWLMDINVGEGILLTSKVGPGPNGYVDHPMIVLDRDFNVKRELTGLVCVDLSEDQHLIPAANQFIMTNNTVIAPIMSNDPAIAPTLV